MLNNQKRLEEQRQLAESGCKEWESRANNNASEIARRNDLQKSLKKEIERLIKEHHERDVKDEWRLTTWNRSINNMRYDLMKQQTDLSQLKGELKAL